MTREKGGKKREDRGCGVSVRGAREVKGEVLGWVGTRVGMESERARGDGWTDGGKGKGEVVGGREGGKVVENITPLPPHLSQPDGHHPARRRCSHLFPPSLPSFLLPSNPPLTTSSSSTKQSRPCAKTQCGKLTKW